MKHSEATRLKMRMNHWSRGPHSERMRAALKARVVSEETKQKRRDKVTPKQIAILKAAAKKWHDETVASGLGFPTRIVSSDTREKLRVAVLRTITPERRAQASVWGKMARVTPELREKRRLARLGKKCPGRKMPPEFGRKMSALLKGRVFSDEHRRKLSTSQLGHAPRPNAIKSKGRKYRRQDGSTIWLQSSWEVAVAKYLDSEGEPWRYVTYSRDDSFLLSTGQRYYPDFFLPRLDLYIDPKGYDRRPEKTALVLREHPGRVVFLIGKTYLDQLKKLLA